MKEKGTEKKKELKNLKNKEIKALLELKNILYQKFPIVEFKLFGSKAKNKSTKESDIDVMIELEKYNIEIEKEIDRIIFEINLKYNVLISALIMDRNEIENGPMSESPIYKVIQKEGISI